MTNTTITLARSIDTLELRTVAPARIEQLLNECVRIDQETYFGEPDYGTPEHRAMVANRRRLERLRCALVSAARRN